MNRLSLKDRAQILSMLVEGNSLRSITRMTGKSINTVTKLLVDVGTACFICQNETLRNLQCKRVQCDEIWSFCGMKQKNVPKEGAKEGIGDVYTFTRSPPSVPIENSVRRSWWLSARRNAPKHSCAICPGAWLAGFN